MYIMYGNVSNHKQHLNNYGIFSQFQTELSPHAYFNIPTMVSKVCAYYVHSYVIYNYLIHGHMMSTNNKI